MERTPEVIVFVGLQGSGKTTFFESRLADAYVHVSKDRFRHNRHKDRRQLCLINEALAGGRSVVVDNTNATVADRAAVIALAKAHGVRVSAYYFPPDVTASLTRNSWRTGKAYVPAVGIYATAKKLQPPSLAEGFDAICTVRTGDHGHFAVRPGLHQPRPRHRSPFVHGQGTVPFGEAEGGERELF